MFINRQGLSYSNVLAIDVYLWIFSSYFNSSGSSYSFVLAYLYAMFTISKLNTGVTVMPWKGSGDKIMKNLKNH